MWHSKIKAPYLALGLALGYIGIQYGLKQYRIARETKKLDDEEEQGARKAERILVASSFYSDLDGLGKLLEGHIILPSDRELYHACRRRAFNLNQRGFPCVIVRVQNTPDIVACLHFINSHRQDIRLCIAGGCHSSKCMMDYTFVIDLSLMNTVQLHRDKLLITVEGGAYLGEMDKLLKPHNLGVTVGTYPQTGIGGLCLGGGHGFLARQFGFCADNLVEAEVVLHDGQVVITNDEILSDLIWGLRGGSGNFGIVTRFTFKVFQLPPTCLGGYITHATPSLPSAVTVAVNSDKLNSSLTNNVVTMLSFPGGAVVSPVLWALFGPANSTLQIPVLQKATQLGGLAIEENSIKLLSYHDDLQTITTPLVMSGHIYHTLVQFGDIEKEMPAAFWLQLLTHTRKPLHKSLIKACLYAFIMGGEITTADPDGTKSCIPGTVRRARYFGTVEVYWKPEFGDEGKEAARDWAREITEIIKPYHHTALRYAAADTTFGTADIIERGNQKSPKLVALKEKYDPTNLFCNNLNIIPIPRE